MNFSHLKIKLKNLLSKSVRLWKKKVINNFFTKVADDGINLNLLNSGIVILVKSKFLISLKFIFSSI